MISSKIIRIEAVQAQLSPAQKKFNATLKKIEVQQALLLEWQSALSHAQHASQDKLEPLKGDFCEAQVAMLVMLDNLYKTQKFSGNQEDKIISLILTIADELISVHGRDELKPLYNQYSEEDFDVGVERDRLMQAQLIQDMFKHRFGVTLDDDEMEVNDLAVMEARLREKLDAQQDAGRAQRASRQQSLKQLAAEAREQEDVAAMSKSIQALYRQLVAALHPDREPDAVERERKTGLMQQANIAYAKKDLLQLLALQLSVQQINQDSINCIAADHLKHYNKVLACQLDELKQEVMMLELRVKEMMGVAPYELLAPKKLAVFIKQQIQALQSKIACMRYDMRAFQDVKYFKHWLKAYRIPQPDFEAYDDIG